MSATLDALARIDDGITDREPADVFRRHSVDPWAAMETRLDEQAADRCVICGEYGDGPECWTCTADWDRGIARSCDL
ncbi:hypothetical protein Ade02nite_19070 [Paractinoplanes deccanensis]|uniref:Small CPxCG-related zinc finger protein n=1 Tax=Paractinoplanes deccanensis TaxID=113561 RepID=A0ABQ3XZU2_9ACTN|nr:hypothetical protein [Actinoplanes deccanensis]GID73266.1 hypothetical protein Ade02nite_19070 [Actinoplanes deccanensis]